MVYNLKMARQRGVSMGSEFVRGNDPSMTVKLQIQFQRCFLFSSCWVGFTFCRFSYLHLILARQSFSCDDLGEGHLQIVVFCD